MKTLITVLALIAVISAQVEQDERYCIVSDKDDDYLKDFGLMCTIKDHASSCLKTSYGSICKTQDELDLT
jgi:hypothetical protein